MKGTEEQEEYCIRRGDEKREKEHEKKRKKKNEKSEVTEKRRTKGCSWKENGRKRTRPRKTIESNTEIHKMSPRVHVKTTRPVEQVREEEFKEEKQLRK